MFHLFIIYPSSWMIKFGKNLQPHTCFYRPVGPQIWDLIQEIKETLKLTFNSTVIKSDQESNVQIFHFANTLKMFWRTKFKDDDNNNDSNNVNDDNNNNDNNDNIKWLYKMVIKTIIIMIIVITKNSNNNIITIVKINTRQLNQFG